MPISVACPSCGARLTAPDAAAGKRVKCRKCQAVLVLPVPEPETDLVIDDDPPEAAAVAPAPKPRVVVEDDDGEDEEDEERPRPRKKKGKRKKKPATNPMLLAGIGVGAAVLLAGAGLAVWHFGFRDRDRAAATSATDTKELAIPDGWEAFDQPAFRAVLPKSGNPVTTQTLPAPGGLQVSTVLKEAEVGGKAVKFVFTSTPMPAKEVAEMQANSDKSREAMLAGFTAQLAAGGNRVLDRKSITSDGNMGIEFHATNAQSGANIVGRVVFKGGTVVSAMVVQPDLQPTDAVAKTFLAGFKMK